jgi:hypothetical protein
MSDSITNSHNSSRLPRCLTAFEREQLRDELRIQEIEEHWNLDDDEHDEWDRALKKLQIAERPPGVCLFELQSRAFGDQEARRLAKKRAVRRYYEDQRRDRQEYKRAVANKAKDGACVSCLKTTDIVSNAQASVIF